MSPTPLLSGRVIVTLAILGSLLGVLGDAYHLVWEFSDLGERSEILGTPLYRAHGVLIGIGYGLLLSAVVGLVAERGRGRLARTGLVVALVGTPFVVGDYWAESIVTPAVVATQPSLADADAVGLHLAALVAVFGVFALGWLLLAIAAYRERWVPRPLAAVAAAGAAIAFTPLAGSNVLLMVAIGAMTVAARRGHAAFSRTAVPT